MNRLLDWLASIFSARLGEVVEMMTGAKPAVESVARPAVSGPALLIRLGFTIVPGAAYVLEIAEKDWIELAHEMLDAAGIPDADRDTAKGTFLEAVSQVASLVARDLSARRGGEVLAESLVEPTESSPDADWWGVAIEAGKAKSVWSAGVTAELIRALDPNQQMEPPAAKPPNENLRTLDLLLDVELPVCVSFGRAQLPLKEVIKLTTGSIVELNRTISEPVEIVVNNHVIARGDVVVVEGNFAVRIQQVVSRQERLKTLD